MPNAKALFDAAPDESAPQGSRAIFDAAPEETSAPSIGTRVVGAIGRAGNAVKSGYNEGLGAVGDAVGIPALLAKIGIKPAEPIKNESTGILKKDSPDWLAATDAFVGGMPGAQQSGFSPGAEHEARAGKFAQENPLSALGLGLAGGLAQPMPAGPAKVPGVPAAPGVLSKLGDALEKMGIKAGRRTLEGGGKISVAKPLSDDAVRAALDTGAIRPLGTVEGAAQRLTATKTGLGEEYNSLISALEKMGVHGPDASALARQMLAKAANAKANSLNPAVSRVYRSAGDQLSSMVKPPQEVVTPGVPPQPSAGATPLGQRTVFSLPPGELPPAAGGALPRGQKDVFTSLPPTLTLHPGTAHEMAGLPVQKDFPGLFPAGQKDVFALPPPQEAAQTAGATVKGPIDTFALPPPGANGIPPQTSFIPADNRLPLGRAESLKRSLQGMAESSYKKLEPTDVGRAQEHAASMLRQAIEDAVDRQTNVSTAPPQAQALGQQFVPLKQQLGKIIEASKVADKAAARAGRNHATSLTDTVAATAGAAAGGVPGAVGGGAVNKLLRTRGSSTAAWSAYKAGGLVQKLGQMAITDPGRLGRFAIPLANAAQRGPDALAAAHFALSTDPDYQRMTRHATNDGAAQ